MADQQSQDAASGTFKLPKWGPKKLREIFKSIEGAINERTPVADLGISVAVTPAGSKIATNAPSNAKGGPNGTGGGGGSSGTPVDLYGAYNGAPAVFHLSQTAAPTPL